MDLQPRLITTRIPADPAGVVLVLHGGGHRGERAAVSRTQLSVLRMIPIAARVAVAGRGRLAVFRLLNSARGWDGAPTPVDDARWALAQISGRFGAHVPVCLVGHSLGGRAALLAGAAPTVRSVVALAPYVYPGDGQEDLTGRRVLIVHGSLDRVADPLRSAAVARQLAGTAELSYVEVKGGRHSMLAKHSVFDRLAADFAISTLLDRPARGVVGRVLAGEEWITL